jgi:cation:H+ antiporter
VLVDLAWLALGLLLLLSGGELLVRGASGLARELGVSPLMIGLTVVAFGTSSPELAVNVLASLEDRGGLSFGNVVGSSMANIGLIVGCAALLRPIPIHGVVIAREIPMMLLATAAAIAMAGDTALGAPPDVLTRGDGAVLLLIFLVFLYYTLGDFAQQRAGSRASPIGVTSPPRRRLGTGASAALGGGGLALLVLGGKCTVDAAVALARALGASQALIGLTVVAIGTSLPELAASLVATLRGQAEIAVGNLVGSNIFNLLFVLGVSSTLQPMVVPPGGHLDLLFVGALSLLLLVVSLTATRRIVRGEAALLLAAYVGYLGWRTSGA